MPCLFGKQDRSRIRETFGTQKKSEKRNLIFITYQNPEVGRLLDQLEHPLIIEMEPKKYYDEFQAIIAEDQPYRFLYVGDTLPIVSSNI